MTKYKKFGLLCITLWPFVYLAYVMAFIWPSPLATMTELSTNLIIVQGITTLILLALIIFYSLHLYSNDEIDEESKLVWLVGFIFTFGFVMIFYWKKFL